MQPELFQDFRPEPSARRLMPPLFSRRFVRFRVAYEDLVFSVLSLVLVLLVGFCLGVERGKKIILPLEVPVVLTQSAAVLPAKVITPAVPAPAKIAAVVEPAAGQGQAVPVLDGQYAIQLASYVTAQAAQVEAERLRRLGFLAKVIKQGKYFELRVVGYRSKAEAMGSLAMLRKTYHDSFVKRLSSG